MGVRFERGGDGSIKINQQRVIERCLEIVGLSNNDEKTKLHDTPAETTKVLHKDRDGPARKLKWNYRSIVGALNYLQGMTRPDLSYAVHQCARFCESPKLSHEQAIKRICRYLKGTKEEGMIFKPNLKEGFKCYVDADRAGNWNKDYVDDESCVKSRTGFLITYAGCPVTWASKLQPLVALSTTESEVIALSAALREAIHMMNLLKELRASGIPIPFVKPKVTCRTFEDNTACIEVAKEPKLRPRTKHLAARLFHFRQHVTNGDITIEHIASSDQIADMLTKALPRDQFQNLRKQFMGW